MKVPIRHFRHQMPALRALAQVALASVRGPRGGGQADTAVTDRVPARSNALIRDYLAAVGGNSERYQGLIPPHLLPQWVLPSVAKVLSRTGYPLSRVLNGGCKLQIRGPIRADSPLVVEAQLVDVSETDRRVVLTTRVTTGPESMPAAVTADLIAVIPGPKRARGTRIEPCLPADVRLLEEWSIPPSAGLTFALLTGDFNPLHWLGPYARAQGFENPILHGFCTMARAFEGLARCAFDGDVSAIVNLDARFRRPLTLPARVGLYASDSEVFVADGPGGPVYMSGHFVASARCESRS